MGDERDGNDEEWSMIACRARRASRDHAACLRSCKQADAMPRPVGAALVQPHGGTCYRLRAARRLSASRPMPPAASSDAVAGSGMAFGSGAYCGGGAEPSKLRFDAY